MSLNDYLSKKDSHIHGDEKFPVAAYWVLDPPHQLSPGVEFVNLPLHWHDEAEIFYMIKGGCRYYIDGKEYILGEKEAIFVCPGVLHWAKLSKTSEPAVSVSVTFHPDFLYGQSNDITSSTYLPRIFEEGKLSDPLLTGKPEWQSRVLDDFLEIISFFDDSGCDYSAKVHTDLTLRLREEADGSELRIKSLFLDIFYLFTKNVADRSQKSGVSKSAYNCLLNSIEYLHEHYNEKLTISELSAHAHMSDGHYSRIFMKYMRCSPFEYLAGYRVNRSIWLLVNTDMKIIDVASESGFQNVSYYNRRFKKIMHCTPTEYRQLNSDSYYRSEFSLPADGGETDSSKNTD